MSGRLFILGEWLVVSFYGGGSQRQPSQTERPSLFICLLDLRSAAELLVCDSIATLIHYYSLSYILQPSLLPLLLCDQNSWFVTIQPASPILSEPAFKETISTVKEGEETDKSESASNVLKVCDNVIMNSLSDGLHMIRLKKTIIQSFAEKASVKRKGLQKL